MLRTRGGNRFEGYGNVKVATEGGNRSGWQLVCYECQELSPIIHRTGASYPPKVLARLFSEQGWKVGNTSASDVCPKCLEQRRLKHKEERKQYAKGNVDRLLDMIRQIDLMLASNVTLEYGPYQPQIAAQLKSLFETAYLCNILTEEMPPASEYTKLVTHERELEAENKRLLKLLEEARDQLLFDEHLETEWRNASSPKPRDEPPDEERTLTLSPDPDPPPEPPPKPSPPPPPPPAPEGERISPRTAAFLAEVRKQIFKGAAV